MSFVLLLKTETTLVRLGGHVCRLILGKITPHAEHPGSKSLCSASTYRDDLLFTGVDDADLLVLAGGAEQAAVAAPADTKDNIRVHVLQVDHGLSRAHVPNDNLVVTP